jgi:hypothetical protein
LNFTPNSSLWSNEISEIRSILNITSTDDSLWLSDDNTFDNTFNNNVMNFINVEWNISNFGFIYCYLNQYYLIVYNQIVDSGTGNVNISNFGQTNDTAQVLNFFIIVNNNNHPLSIINNEVTAFDHTYSGDVYIQNNVTAINSNSFENCTNVNFIKLAERNITIHDSGFKIVELKHFYIIIMLLLKELVILKIV